MADTAGQLAKLKSLLELGALSPAEHDQRRQAILDAEFGISTSPSGGAPGKKGTADGFQSSMVIGPADRPYQLEEKLGEGGMGQVWRAQDMAESETVGKPVWKAVKILPLTPDTDPTQYKWLKQEAMLAARLSHPSIVRVFDWREDHTTGLPFIVMEWLQGMDLGKVLAKEGNPGLPFERVIELLTPVVEALDYAWAEHSLVHRDIKPGNIFLTQEGRIKLLDFGIAARGRKTSSLLNFEGREQAGTEGYRAPETRAKQKPHPKLDVYALGVLVYELLEGDTPFEGERSPYTPLPDKPRALNDAQWLVLQQAFAFEAPQRPETTVEFWQTIHRAAGPTVEELERQRLEQAAQKQAEDMARMAREEEAKCKAKDEARSRAEEEKKRIAAENARQTAEAEAKRLKEELERRQAEARVQEEKCRHDEERWQRLTAKNDIDGYRRYLLEAESDHRRQEAKEKLKALEDAAREEAELLRQKEEVKRVEEEERRRLCVVIGGKTYKPGDELPLDFEGAPQMVAIPPGRFMMGSVKGEAVEIPEYAWGPWNERPRHEVTINYWLAVGKFPVTRGEFRVFAEANGYARKGKVKVGLVKRFLSAVRDKAEIDDDEQPFWDEIGYGDDRCPVRNITRSDAQAYVSWLSRVTGKCYRLLSESEWEYACRADTTTKYFWGDNDSNWKMFVSDLKTDYGASIPVAVGTRKPNGWGLFDMIGNVQELVEDCWNDSYRGAPRDGSAWKIDDCSIHVARGEHFCLSSDDIRSAKRDSVHDGARHAGFRIAKTFT